MKRIFNFFKGIADSRPPDFVIGGADAPYMLRWWVIPRNRFFNVYLHHFLRSDDDRALHTHPWLNVSILLEGSYVEHLVEGAFRRRAGNVVMRWSGHIAHRIELTDGPCWSLFITGPVYKDWGFLCPQGRSSRPPESPVKSAPGATNEQNETCSGADLRCMRLIVSAEGWRLQCSILLKELQATHPGAARSRFTAAGCPRAACQELGQHESPS